MLIQIPSNDTNIKTLFGEHLKKNPFNKINYLDKIFTPFSFDMSFQPPIIEHMMQ